LANHTFTSTESVMVSFLSSSSVDRGFKPRLGQTNDYKIGICCFSTQHTALRNKSKDWLTWNQNNVSEWIDMFTHRFNVSEWIDMFTHRLLLARAIKIQLSWSSTK